MKLKIFFWGIFFAIFCTYNGFAQQDSTIIFTDSVSYKKPIFLNKGVYKLKVEFDGLYLVNKHRFSLYEDAKNAVLELNYSTIGNIIDEYEKRLTICEEAKEELSQNIGKKVEMSIEQIDTSVDSLSVVRHSLDGTKQTMEQANKNLEIAQKQIKKEKWIWGAGGAAIGIILGIILGK